MSMGTVIVDYGAGNPASVANVLRRLAVPSVLSSDPDTILAADRLIVVGAGAFDPAMQSFHAAGVCDALNQAVCMGGTPFLGICLGMQILGRRSEEGALPGLGWLAAESVKFNPEVDSGLKVPHMGWNRISVSASTPLLSTADDGKSFYFVHSYHLVCDDPGDVAAWCDHGTRFTAAVCRGNIMGTQFHPEKSQTAGLELFKRFLSL